MTSESHSRMPAVFFGHGNPMYAIQDNPYTKTWQQLGASLPRPKAILVVSAHWTTRGTAVTAMAAPRTIHDFGGFPQALFDVQYPAPGDTALAGRVRDLLAPLGVHLDHSWGLDHGSWAVLHRVYPQADVPVVQLSLDITQPAAFHFELGRKLAALREESILVIGSGNVVHNLRLMSWGEAPPLDWATRFNDKIREHLLRGEFDQIVDYQHLGQDARLAVPTVEHFLPLLYVIGTRQQGEPVSIAADGIDGGSISMLTAVIGN